MGAGVVSFEKDKEWLGPSEARSKTSLVVNFFGDGF